MMIKTILGFVLILSMSVGCATRTTGTRFNAGDAKKIKTGVTTKQEIVQMFGQPTMRHVAAPGNESWTYVFSEGTTDASLRMIPLVGGFMPLNIGGGSKTLALTMEDNVVTGCRFMTAVMGANIGVLGPTHSEGLRTESVPCGLDD